MKVLKPLCIILVVVYFLGGCSIRSSQLSSVISTFKQPSISLASYSWTVSYGEYRAQLYAVSMPDGTLFTNQAGDSVLFDEWTIKEVKGMGINRVNWNVIDNNNSRRFFRGNSFIGEHFCRSWVSEKRYEMIRYNQECKGFNSYSNSILVDMNGRISLVRQNINGNDKFITLNKNK